MKNKNRIVIQPLQENNLKDVVKIHVETFPKAPLTKLGPKILYRYYLWQLAGPHQAYNIGAFSSADKLIGFCFGGVFNGATGGFIHKESAFLIWSVISRPWLFFNPVFRDRLKLGSRLLLKWMKLKPISTIEKAMDPASDRDYGILAISVEPNCWGMGVGRLLMEHSEADARRKGFQMMNLTVHPENKQAIRFYKGLSWQQSLSSGTWDGKMFKDLRKR